MSRCNALLESNKWQFHICQKVYVSLMKENKNSDRESPYQEAVILLLEPVNVLIPFSYQGTLSAIQLYKAIKK